MDFYELTKRISPKLNAISHKLNGRFAYFNEDDLCQEAMIHLWDKFNKKELQDKTDSFILQGCFFFLKNYIRKTYKKVDSKSISLSEIINSDEDSENTFADIYFLKDKADEIGDLDDKLLREKLNNILNKREKEVLNLCLQGLTTRQIGEKIELSHVMIVKIVKGIREKCRIFKDEIF